MNKINFTKIAKNILHTKEGVRDRKIMHPEREWGIGITLGVILLCSIAVWSSKTYLSNKEIVISENFLDENEVIVYRESMVKAALDSFKSRDDRHKQLLKEAEVVTPSVEVENDAVASSTKQTQEVPEESEEGEVEIVDDEQEIDFVEENEIPIAKPPEVLLVE